MAWGSIPWNDPLPYVVFFKEIRGLFSEHPFVTICYFSVIYCSGCR
jgi:hypothetical protein